MSSRNSIVAYFYRLKVAIQCTFNSFCNAETKREPVKAENRALASGGFDCASTMVSYASVNVRPQGEKRGRGQASLAGKTHSESLPLSNEEILKLASCHGKE